jgi:dolichol kinase
MNHFNSLNSFFFDYKVLVYLVALVLELIILYPLFAFFKWSLLARLKMPLAERKLIFSNRRKNFDLKYFVDKYGDRNLRIVDGLSRKLLHIATGCWRLLIFNLIVQNTQVSLKVTLLFQVIAVCLFIVSYSSNKIFGLAGILYGATSRIRDGIYGRKNIFIAQFSFLSLFPLFLLEKSAINNLADSSYLLLFPSLIFFPITIGDALGEIIGTIWGKQKLRVWGVGEINRKSLLGTVSVFLGSLLPLLLIVFFNALPWPWWLMCLSIALITTLVELIAPRGTDNFFIPLANALVCLIFISGFTAI